MGQRIQHGHVRVLMDLAGWQIIGLTRAFHSGQAYFKDEQGAANACKLHCYSDINCQFWQYAPDYGCWVEDASQGYWPQYPLTLDFASRETPFALNCRHGEFVQHKCIGTEAEWPSNLTCALPDTEYIPKAFDSWNQERFVMHMGSCQKMCREIATCGFFTYWPDGLCKLHDANALPAPTHDGAISGRPYCNATMPVTTTSTTNIQGIHGGVGGMVGRCVPLDAQEQKLYHYARFNITARNLDYSVLASPQNGREEAMLKALYLRTMSTYLGVEQMRFMDTTTSVPASIELAAGPPRGTTIGGLIRNKPPTSCNFAWLEGKINGEGSAALLAELRRTTIGNLGMGSNAIRGDLQVVAAT